MGLTRLVVHIDGDKAVEKRIDFTAGLSAQHDADVIGVFARVPNPATASAAWPGLPDSGFMDQLVEAHTAELDRQIETLKPKFDAAMRDGKGTATWREVSAFRPEAIIRAARSADLVVVPQPDEQDPTNHMDKFAVSDVVMRSGRPVLFHPYIGAKPDMQKVLIAWDGGRESVRALHDAAPFLKGADILFLSVVTSGQANVNEADDQDMLDYAAGLGATAKIDRHVGSEMRVSDVVMSRAADFGATLVVMGGYSHSRFRELVLGGATREILDQMPVPVMMSH